MFLAAQLFASFAILVNLAPMRDPRHVDGFGGVVNLVDNAVIAQTNAPLIIAAFEFFAARRPGEPPSDVRDAA
jgi:hypothetical protein